MFGEKTTFAQRKQQGRELPLDLLCKMPRTTARQTVGSVNIVVGCSVCVQVIGATLDGVQVVGTRRRLTSN